MFRWICSYFATDTLQFFFFVISLQINEELVINRCLGEFVAILLQTRYIFFFIISLQIREGVATNIFSH